MKRWIALLCMLIMVASVIGCSKGEEPTKDNKAESAETQNKSLGNKGGQDITIAEGGRPCAYVEESLSLPDISADGEHIIGSVMNQQGEFELYTATSDSDIMKNYWRKNTGSGGI